ncbi:tRNA(His) guanylyltransferase Thg1 family protein [Sulfuricurvum sp.]|uniref:tRNA(His) guanylyltransferase Thg1 family protein n=1 Tax=Sulfuricurvum sp. TaxID=2025608 RepID=UPI0035689BE0
MDSIGDRMKNNYENRSRFYLNRRTPVIMRLDGKAFHTMTRKYKKPFDVDFINAMSSTAAQVLKEIQGAKCAYIQSDEISILITDFDRLNTDAWFDYNIQKMTSVSAGIASVAFSHQLHVRAFFDSRVFNIPKEEVTNYFVWRQKDWFRNSIQMLAQAHFSHKQLHGKNTSDMHEMLHTKDINWADLDDVLKNGRFICYDREWTVICPCPIFTKDRQVIENLLIPVEE